MGARLEQRQRLVAARQFVVAIAAVGGRVAGGALGPVQRGVLAVQIVFPARRMVRRPHHLMAGCRTAIFAATDGVTFWWHTEHFAFGAAASDA